MFDILPDDVLARVFSCVADITPAMVSLLELTSKQNQHMAKTFLWRVLCERLHIGAPVAGSSETTSTFDVNRWKNALRRRWGDPNAPSWLKAPAVGSGGGVGGGHQMVSLPSYACMSSLVSGGWPPKVIGGDEAGRLHRYDMSACRFGDHAECTNGVRTLRPLEEHDQTVCCIVLHQGIDRLYSGDEEGVIVAWKLSTGEHLRTMNGHTQAVRALATYHNCLISGSDDRTVRVWDSRGELVDMLLGKVIQV